MSSARTTSSRPRLACEINADRVLAGLISEGGHMLETYAARDLPPGAVVPDLTESNLRSPEAVRQAVREVLESVAGRTRDVTAVLPDAAARVVLLDFDTLPEKPQEAQGVVRFRLKKSLPFDVDKAAISYHHHIAADKTVRVVAVVMLTQVLTEYETLFRDCGFSPGVVVPSMIAALGAAESSRPTLVVKVDARTTSIAIVDQEQLLLFRTLENARGREITGEQLAEEVYPSVVFFQDTYHLNLEKVYVSGVPESAGAGPALRTQTGAEVQELVSSSHLGGSTSAVPRWRMAGVVGALVS